MSVDFVVPVEDSITLPLTIEYTARKALEQAGIDRTTVHFVYLATYEDRTPSRQAIHDRATELLRRAEIWARNDVDEDDRLVIETALIGEDEHLFSPKDYADLIVDYAQQHGIEQVILDPEYQPGSVAPMLGPLEATLERRGVRFEEAPVEHPTRRTPLRTAGSLSRFVTLFTISYLFYLLLGDPTYWYDLITGAITGLIVALSLSHVTFSNPPDPVRSPVRLARMVPYLPYLGWKIIQGNVHLAAIVLHPAMPIDPHLARMRIAVWGRLPVTTFANSLALAPGTIVIRTDSPYVLVHALTPTAREDLFEGGLERAVRFVFYGYRASRIESPRERGATEILRTNEITNGTNEQARED